MSVVYVLWAVAFLAVIAGALLSVGQTAYHIAHNAVEDSQTNALIEAAVNRAVLAIFEPSDDDQWRVDGTPRIISFEGTNLRVAIQDETGRIDLNQADQSLVAGLFRSIGLDIGAADSLTDQVLDWRDASPFRRLNGAKEVEYRLAGRNYRPRNGPFQSIDEIRLVLGMTPDLFRQIRPAITVYSGHPFIDPDTAPLEALKALPSMNTAALANQMAMRSRTREPFRSLFGRTFSINVVVLRETNSMSRVAVVRLTGDSKKPFWILDWNSP